MKIQTVNRQLLYLFFSSFAILFVGMGVFPLLPLYAGEFGATWATTGIYLALTYVSITAGTMMTGWLAERWTRKRTFVAAGALGVPALALMGQAVALWQVVILTGVIWFSGGIGLALVGIFTGLYADKRNRGKSFGLMALASPLGAVVGGTVVGQLVETGGYPLMFAVLAVVWAGWPALAAWKIKDKAASARASTAKESAVAGKPGSALHLLLAATLLTALTVSVSRMGSSMLMKAQAFSPGDISSATVVGGLITIPVTLGVGALSDRLGRKQLLALSYLVAAAGAVTLSAAGALWQYWSAMALLLAARSTNSSVSSAYATDLLPPRALGHGLSRLHAMTWIAGIVGFAGAGYGMGALGARPLILGTGALSVLAALMLEFRPGEAWNALIASARRMSEVLHLKTRSQAPRVSTGEC